MHWFPLILWVKVVLGVLSSWSGVGVMQDWPDKVWGGCHMTILKLRAGTAVHDFKIDQYWPKRKGPGPSSFSERSEQSRFGLEDKDKVPSWLGIRPCSRNQDMRQRWLNQTVYLHKRLLSKFYPSFKTSSKLFFSWSLSWLPPCIAVYHFQCPKNPWELHTVQFSLIIFSLIFQVTKPIQLSYIKDR